MKYELLAEFTVSGQPPRKSNSREIATRGRGGRPFLIKSKEAREYQETFSEKIDNEYKQAWGSLKENLRLDINVWYRDRRSDLSVELILDCLEKAGVIKNDRYVREYRAKGFTDKENQRISVRLYRINGERIPEF